MTLDDPAIAMKGYQYRHGDRPLEGYTIQRAAGRGGFGEVYYATSDSGREVALKVVNTFEQVELRGISQCMNLKSPHLVTIFDVRHGSDGRPWVIMEFVAGPSLREILDASPAGLGPAKAAFFLREIGKGLTYLHDCGIVHRDLKPENIFFENGYVKIGDYGLSKAMSMSRHSGQTVAVGTLHYMAPEIGEGKYDRSIDIYAMGALLYEMVTGQVPFYGSSPAEVLMKHLTADVHVEGIEEPFKSVIRKAMAKNPAERYASAREMVEAVFGSAVVRESVSQLSPESLSTAAGRAGGRFDGPARPQAAGGAAGAAAPAADPRAGVEAWDRDPVPGADGFIGRFEEAGQRVKAAGDRAAERLLGRRYYDARRSAVAGRVVYDSAPVRNDPLAWPWRVLLALAVVAAAGLVAGANADGKALAVAMSSPSTRNGLAMANADGKALAMVIEGLFAALAVMGAVTGAALAWGLGARALAGESRLFRRFAVGSAVAFGALVLAFPLCLNRLAWHGGQGPAAMMATFIALMLIHWEERLAGNRPDRLSLGHLLTAGILGLILAGVCDAPMEVVVPAVMGASLAVSLFAARDPLAAAAAVEAARRRPVAPPPIPGVGGQRRSSGGEAPPPGEWGWDWRKEAERARAASANWAKPPPAGPPPGPPPAAVHGARLGALALGLPVLILCAVAFMARPGPFTLAALIAVPMVLVKAGGTVLRGGPMSTGYAGPVPMAPGFGAAERDGGLLGGLVRFVVGAAGGLLLLASLLAVVAVGSDVPALIASAVSYQQTQRDFEYALGPNWPLMIGRIGLAAAAVAGFMAVVMMLLARRSGGPFCLLRTLVGVAVLYAAAVGLGHALPAWTGFTVSDTMTPGAVVDWYFQRMQGTRVLVMLVVGAVGVGILSWAPRRRRRWAGDRSLDRGFGRSAAPAGSMAPNPPPPAGEVGK